MTNETPPTFEAFMSQVDAILQSKLFMGHRDLIDYCWYDSYESGISPEEAIQDAAEEWAMEYGDDIIAILG